ncbi:MAG: wax ester/triacylglycerol synthase family O-acyltransferase [Dermatophilaceae bacterium]
MRQLSGMDAEFLAMESGAVQGHFGTVTVVRTLTGAPLDVRAVRERVASCLTSVPVLRQRLLTVAFGVDQPYWVDDTGFDLDFHVREVALPTSSDLWQLANAVAGLHARRLDRRRPLWELYLISGLSEGRSAIYLKIHHAVMDGAGWSALMDALLDDEPGNPALPAGAWEARSGPTQWDLMRRGGWSMTRSSVRSVKLGLDFMFRAPLVAANRLAPEQWPLPLTAPPTPFNREITGARSCVLVDLPMADVLELRRRADATVNDVVMAVVAGALRRWLIDAGALPVVPLIAVVPVSVRDRRDGHAFGNRLSLVRGLLPTHLEDPLERLAATREEMRASRRRHGARPPQLLIDAAQFAPPIVADAAWRLSARVMKHVNAWNVMVSNVRGPDRTRYLAGAEVIGNYPVSVLVHGQGLNISVFSIAGRLCWGLIADPSLVPNLPRLGAYLGDELELLCEAMASTG